MLKSFPANITLPRTARNRRNQGNSEPLTLFTKFIPDYYEALLQARGLKRRRLNRNS